MNNPTHLFLRHHTWFVKKRVPTDLRKRLNKTVIVKSTGKRDLREAKAMRSIILGELELEWELARNPRDTRLESFRKFVEWVREEQRAGKWREDNLSPDELTSIAFDDLYEKQDGSYVIPEEHKGELQALYRIAREPEANILKDTIEQYIEQKKGSTRESTLNEKQRHLKQFSDWIGPHSLLTDVTPRDAGNYLSNKMMRETTQTGAPLSSATLKKHLNIFKAFFSWAESMGMIEKNPFNKTADKLPKKSTGARDKVNAWHEEELITLLEAIKKKGNSKLASITLLAMYTGARGNELAELKASDVTSWSLKIQSDTKNAHSQRNIPIHSKVHPLVNKLLSTSTDGYLISGLTRGGEDNKRYHYIAKTFSSMKDRLGFPKRTKVFHSFRHSLVTRLLNAGEPIERISGAVGHIEDVNFTLNTYSDGLEITEAIKVIETLDYRAKVNQLVDELIEVTSN